MHQTRTSGPEERVSATPRLVAEVDRRPGAGVVHARAVRSMFDRISPTYDLLNRLLSLGVDRAWRRRALDALCAALPPEGAVIDLCAGTLDLAQDLRARLPGRPVVALDFAREMLVAGRAAGKARGGTALAVSDALRLPLAGEPATGGEVAGVVCGFGVRNLADVRRGADEVFRVLRPGGVYVCLEFFRPSRLATRAFHAAYGDLVLPTVGRLVSRDREAYAYLSRSMKAFLPRRAYEATLREAGFVDVRGEDLLFGIASIVCARRPTAAAGAGSRPPGAGRPERGGASP
jgi:ubiquinone/menaquinone biosynthesis methyltransferase